jgi:hypothetical protein
MVNGRSRRVAWNASRRIERRANGEYGLWQRQFWEHTIRDENDFARYCRLHSFQSRQTRPRLSRAGLAALASESAADHVASAAPRGPGCRAGVVP